MENENENTHFQVAHDIHELLRAYGLSKNAQKRALSLVLLEYGERAVPIGVPVGNARNQVKPDGTQAVGPRPKGPATRPKDPKNLDPKVIAAQAMLDAVLVRIRQLKSENRDVSPEILQEKTLALAALHAAKAAALRPSQASLGAEEKSA